MLIGVLRVYTYQQTRLDVADVQIIKQWHGHEHNMETPSLPQTW